MKGIVCKDCGYIAINGVQPGTCPVCKNNRFEDQADAIHMPGDATGFSESEKKHIPSITVVKACGLIEGCVDVHVKIGSTTHPMLAEHYINNIDFYLNKEFIARAELRPDKIHPAGVVHLKASSGTITAVERCNLHGAWMAETAL